MVTRRLCFEAHKGDPLAILLIDWLKLKEWQFALVYVALYLASVIAGFVFYFIRDGSPDMLLLGGVESIATQVIFVVVVGGVGSFLYIRINQKTGSLYEDLAEAAVINRENDAVRSTVLDGEHSNRHTHKRRLWWVLALFITLLAALGFAYQSGVSPHLAGYGNYHETGLDPETAEITAYRAVDVFATMPIFSLGLYIIIMTATRALVTIRGLYKVFNIGDVNVQPLHPDKIGGLTHLRDYAMSVTFLLAAFGFGIVSYIFITSQVVYNGEIVTDLTRTASFPMMWVLGAAYLVLAPVIFFGTLGSAHLPMMRRKTEDLQVISDKFNSDFRVLQTQLRGDSTGIGDRVDELHRLRELHKTVGSFPVWPWDWGSIRRFVSAVFGFPLLSSLLGTTILQLGGSLFA